MTIDTPETVPLKNTLLLTLSLLRNSRRPMTMTIDTPETVPLKKYPPTHLVVVEKLEEADDDDG